VVVSDLNQLGPELHAASFTLKMGGRCRLHESPRWLHLNQRGLTTDLKRVLPQTRNANVLVEGLDLSGTVITYDGLANIGIPRHTKFCDFF
jgi:hypothetical protein